MYLLRSASERARFSVYSLAGVTGAVILRNITVNKEPMVLMVTEGASPYIL